MAASRAYDVRSRVRMTTDAPGGRVHQKQRTRAAIVAAARDLIKLAPDEAIASAVRSAQTITAAAVSRSSAG